VQMSEDSFPKLVGKPRFPPDRRTCVVKVKLEPDKTYVIWLNSDRFKKTSRIRISDPRYPIFWRSRQQRSGFHVMQARSPWGWWIAVGVSIAVFGCVDQLTGHELNFFAFYFVSVGIAAWHLGLGASFVTAMTCAFVWYSADFMSGHIYSSNLFAVWNTLIRLCSFLLVGWFVHTVRQLLISESDQNEKLRQALEEIKVLEGLLPICAQCKKIRDDQGGWQQVEAYIGEHTKAKFSHGYCPECARKLLKDAHITSGGTQQGVPPATAPKGDPPRTTP
jgi:hypothetical protein